MSTADEEDQANEELALAEICGHQEFESIDQQLINEFKKKFDNLPQDFHGENFFSLSCKSQL